MKEIAHFSLPIFCGGKTLALQIGQYASKAVRSNLCPPVFLIIQEARQMSISLFQNDTVCVHESKGISRRGFVSTVAGMGAASVIALNSSASMPERALAGEAAGSSSDLSSSGENHAETQVYVGSGTGLHGTVRVCVTISEDKILDVSVVEQHDSEHIGSRAFQILCDRVQEAQTSNVDIVSGATFSSMGFLEAVKNALSGVEGFDGEAGVTGEPRSDEEADVVVVGCGGSGMMTALTLAYNGFTEEKNEDLKVIIVEKQGIPGGSTTCSTGAVAVPDGLKANDVEDVHTTVEGMLEFLADRSGRDINSAVATRIFSGMADTVTELVGMGAPWVTNYCTRKTEHGDWSYLEINPGDSIYPEDSDGNPVSMSREGGDAVAEFLRSKVLQAGIDIRFDSTATDLIVENGAVAGVSVTDKLGNYDIRAKKTVLACGGFIQNRDMINELIPDYAGVTPFAGGGCDGDGIVMARAVDAVVDGDGVIGYLGNSAQDGIYSSLRSATTRNPALWVDATGQRFCDETSADSNAMVKTVCALDGSRFYGIIDSAHAAAQTVEQYVEAGSAECFSGNTLEELAEAMGLDIATLEATVEKYNEAAEAGNDEEFGADPSLMTPIKQAPFYGYVVIPVAIGTMAGLKIDENFAVVNSSDVPVENLYAVGELIVGGNVIANTYSGGVGVGTAIMSGRLVGERIKEELGIPTA
jgi:fumarate reductase flavoprotein subunit